MMESTGINNNRSYKTKRMHSIQLQIVHHDPKIIIKKKLKSNIRDINIICRLLNSSKIITIRHCELYNEVKKLIYLVLLL